MKHIGSARPNVPPVQRMGRPQSDPRYQGRHGANGRGSPLSDDPETAQPFSTHSKVYDARTSPNAGPIWWSAHVDGAGQGDQADAARQGRVRTAQMLRALRELVDMGGDGRANAARLSHAITGEVLDMDAPGGDDARIIECVAKE